METEALTLADFLLARIAEDREAADQANWAMQGEWYAEADGKVDEYVQRLSPARVLAECEAKRRIVEWASDGEGEFHWGSVLAPQAAVYADHPDYRPEWRPDD